MKTTKSTPTKTPRASSTRAATAAKKTPAATTAPKKKPSVAKAAEPLISPRVTKAAANAKRALTPVSTLAKSPKAAAPKKAVKAVAKPKPAALATEARATSVQTRAASTASALAPAVQSSSRSPKLLTTIEAFIDVGFGNRLTLRGEGAGLSWERGLTLNCIGSAEWAITLEGAESPLAFKFLLNDEQWSVGENYTLAPGKTGAFTPEF